MAKWGLVAAAVAVAVGVPYFYRQLDQRLCKEIETLLAVWYPHLQVSVRSVELVHEAERQGIRIRGIHLAEPEGETWRPLLECEEVFLSCPTDLVHLAQGDVPVRRMVLRRPTWYLRRTADGIWNYVHLQPKTSGATQNPELQVEEGTVVISAGQGPQSRPILLRDLHVVATPLEEGIGERPGEERSAPSSLRQVRMSLSGGGLEQLELEGWVDLAGGGYSIQGKATHWEWTPEWQELLPMPGRESWQSWGVFQGNVDLSFRVSRLGSDQTPLQWEVSGRLTNGRFHGERLPYPLTDIWAVFRADTDGLRVDQLFARHGPSTVRLCYRRNGYRADSPMHLEAEIRSLELRREWLDLAGLAAVSLSRHWELYRPSGQAHLYLTLDYDGQHWFPEAIVECLDVSFLYAKFPYRLDHGRGRVELRNNTLWLHLTAFSENQPVRIAAEIFAPLSQPYGWVEIEGERLPIDQKFFDALSEPTRRFLLPLHAQGTLDVRYRWHCQHPSSVPHRQISLKLSRGAICYDRFPYPIRNLRGTLEFTDGRWEFWGLTGSNGSAQIRGYGYLIPLENPIVPASLQPPGGSAENRSGLSLLGATSPQALGFPKGAALYQSLFEQSSDRLPPMELYLHLVADRVPLDEELRDALPRAAQRLWNQLRPLGQVNLQELEIRYRTDDPAAEVRFTAQPIPERSSIEPVAFPYRMENLEGTIFFAQNRVFWQGFRAEHGAARISADLFGRFQPDGAWQLEMENLFVDRLSLDRELTKALPDQLKKVFTTLNPEGTLALQGRWELAQAGEPSAQQTSQWDLALTLAGARLQPGILLENIHGGVRLAGQFHGQQYHTWGELELDSVMYQGYQFTQIQGPFWMDTHYVLFGPDAEARRREHLASVAAGESQAPPPGTNRLLTGQWFGGTATGQGWIRLGTEPEFAFRATLSDADLARIAQEYLPGIQNLRGKLYGWGYLHGHGKNLHTLTGQGALHLREADLYELPVMIALLKVLNLRRPDTHAFSACDVDYRITGPHIYLDRIVFQGDAISLHGAGETNFQGEINLALSPILGREDRKSLLLKQLLGGAGQEFMVIRITGSLQDPKTEKEVFPTLNLALQHLAAVSAQRGAPISQRRPIPFRRLPPSSVAGLPRTFDRPSPTPPELPAESAQQNFVP